MRPRKLATGWVHYAFWAFDHSLERARRGMFGQRPVPAAPPQLEESVRSGGESGRSMIIRTIVWMVAAYVLLSPVLVWWVQLNEYAFERGVSLDVVWSVFVTGRLAIGLVTAVGYVAFVLGSFKCAMRGLRDTRAAVLALEEMPAEERAAWVDDYRSEPRPACEILEKRSPVFRSLVGETPD